ncbi:alpha/beta hydrolase [Microbacteriaceae bacterium 4G12]
MKRRKKKSYLIISIFCILIVTLVVWIQYKKDNQYSQDNKENTAKFNIAYGKESQKQKLDIYVPKLKTKEKHPVIIYAHGGGWNGGDKSNVVDKPAFFTNAGYVFVSINYRLYPEATYDQMANDVSSAIGWVYKNADTYHIDVTKINLMGHSAGGHLMGLVSTNAMYLKRVDLSPSMLCSIIDLDGPMDIAQFIQGVPSSKEVFGEDKAVWRQASPITYVTTQKMPPVYVVTSGKYSSASNFARMVQKAGNTAVVFDYKTLSHSEVTKMLGATEASEEAKQMTNSVMEFLKKYNENF